jgi:hypothetical protein
MLFIDRHEQDIRQTRNCRGDLKERRFYKKFLDFQKVRCYFVYVLLPGSSQAKLNTRHVTCMLRSVQFSKKRRSFFFERLFKHFATIGFYIKKSNCSLSVVGHTRIYTCCAFVFFSASHFIRACEIHTT